MAVYAVGDIQGCYAPLSRLLENINFDPAQDTLWCVGDLVNRGPDSLEVINLLKSLKNQCVSVLGNHDLHLLSMVYGIRTPRPNDTLNKILESPQVDEIAHWLRQLPLLHHDAKSGHLLCHAGIYPWWTLEQAVNHADEVSTLLRDDSAVKKLLSTIYGNSPNKWRDDLGPKQRRRFIINAFTRMRFVSPKGRLNFSHSGYQGLLRKNRLPWFKIPNPSLDHYKVIFGHWSAAGLKNKKRYLGLDTGCVWGRHMTMVKLPEIPTTKKIKKSDIFICPNINSPS